MRDEHLHEALQRACHDAKVCRVTRAGYGDVADFLPIRMVGHYGGSVQLVHRRVNDSDVLHGVMRLLPLELRPGDREVLEGWARAGTIEARIAKRARIVVLAADGVPNRQIGVMVDMHYNQVAVWRRRYAESGLAGLGDEERPGRPFVYSHDDVLLLVKTVTEPPPDQATRWTMEALAKILHIANNNDDTGTLWCTQAG